MDQELIPFNIQFKTIDQDKDGLSDTYDPSVLDFDLFNNKLYVEPVKTTADKKQIYNIFLNKLNSDFLAKACTGQLLLESGNFKYSYNYNHGNIKPNWKSEHNFTMYSCSEVYKGKEYHYQPGHIQSCFLAFQNDNDFINYYINLLKTGRYKKVLQTSNSNDFVHELKVAGYFTADESLYLKVLNNRINSI